MSLKGINCTNYFHKTAAASNSFVHDILNVCSTYIICPMIVELKNFVTKVTPIISF